jgi:hypothetical protein
MWHNKKSGAFQPRSRLLTKVGLASMVGNE